jgi:hypothetical protein
MSDLASVIGALSTTGVEAYEIAQGAPVTTTQVTPGGLVSVGSSAISQGLLPILLIAAAAIVLWLLLK